MVKVVHYSDLDRERVNSCREYALTLVEAYERDSKNKLEGRVRMTTSLQLAHLLASLPDGDFDLHRRSILDLGCGSPVSPDGASYPPSLKWVLNHGEIGVLGLDLRGDYQDIFPPTLMGDINDPRIFDRINTGAIDIIHSRGLVDSPTFRATKDDRDTSSSLLRIHGVSFERILKPTGYVLWCDNMIGMEPGGYVL